MSGRGWSGLPAAPAPRRAAAALGLLLAKLLTTGLLVWALAAPAGAAPTVLRDDRGRDITLAVPAQRIVSLLPSHTETVCELGACARLVGTDRYSNWPASVSSLPKLGGLEDTQIERLVALKPDLVLAAVSSRAVERLESLGLTVLALEPRDLAGVRRTVLTVAAALGEAPAGAALVQRLDERLAAAAARVPAVWRGATVYFEVAATPYAAGEASFVGELLAQLGLRNVVPRALGPFPQLSPEFVVRAHPQLVMASAQALADMAKRPGFDRLKALSAGHQCAFAPAPWDTLVRSGPRLAEGAEAIANCLAALPAPVRQAP
jgi:iron complex transport system substrate-binding protein